MPEVTCSEHAGTAERTKLSTLPPLPLPPCSPLRWCTGAVRLPEPAWRREITVRLLRMLDGVAVAGLPRISAIRAPAAPQEDGRRTRFNTSGISLRSSSCHAQLLMMRTGLGWDMEHCLLAASYLLRVVGGLNREPRCPSAVWPLLPRQIVQYPFAQLAKIVTEEN